MSGDNLELVPIPCEHDCKCIWCAQVKELASLRLENARLGTLVKELQRVLSQEAQYQNSSGKFIRPYRVERLLEQSPSAALAEFLGPTITAMLNAKTEIETYHIDWACYSSESPDYDCNYKPSFPPVVQELAKELSRLSAIGGAK